MQLPYVFCDETFCIEGQTGSKSFEDVWTNLRHFSIMGYERLVDHTGSITLATPAPSTKRIWFTQTRFDASRIPCLATPIQRSVPSRTP